MNVLVILSIITFALFLPALIHWFIEKAFQNVVLARIISVIYLLNLYRESYEWFSSWDSHPLVTLPFYILMGPMVGAAEITNEYIICVSEARCSND